MITIDKSSERDLRAILYRLKREYEQNGCGEGFYHNRHRIRQAHRQAELYVVRENAKCVGFQFKSSDGFGIIDIHPAMRGKGYGSILATLWVKRAAENGEAYVAVECATPEAGPFWQAMGFTLVDVNCRPYAYRLLPKRFKLNPDSELVDVEITFYKATNDGEQAQPLFTHRPPGRRSR
jgi:GNAT superfamily N-acetyltransferase